MVSEIYRPSAENVPLNKGQKLKVYKKFRRRPGRR